MGHRPSMPQLVNPLGINSIRSLRFFDFGRMQFCMQMNMQMRASRVKQVRQISNLESLCGPSSDKRELDIVHNIPHANFSADLYANVYANELCVWETDGALVPLSADFSR